MIVTRLRRHWLRIIRFDVIHYHWAFGRHSLSLALRASLVSHYL
jgi:hypothetical protein